MQPIEMCQTYRDLGCTSTASLVSMVIPDQVNEGQWDLCGFRWTIILSKNHPIDNDRFIDNEMMRRMLLYILVTNDDNFRCNIRYGSSTSYMYSSWILLTVRQTLDCFTAVVSTILLTRAQIDCVQSIVGSEPTIRCIERTISSANSAHFQRYASRPLLCTTVKHAGPICDPMFPDCMLRRILSKRVV